MQTFLPYPNYAEAVKTLDLKRLNKQRIETFQILKALKGHYGPNGAWTQHPVTKMWEGYELALLQYQEATINEWSGNRGYKDTCWQKSRELFSVEELACYKAGEYEHPPWLGDAELHAAYRSNLIRKNPEFYRPVFGYEIPDDLPYEYLQKNH